MNFKETSAILATWVSIGAAVVGGYIGLQTYQRDVSRRADARVVQTFDFYRDFYGAEMMRLRNRVADQVERSSRSAASTPGAGQIMGQPIQRKGAAFAGLSEPVVIQTDQDLFAFIDYFDAVCVCVEKELCDAELVNQLYGPYAQGMYPGLTSTIERIREAEVRNGFHLPHPAGYGLERLAAMQCEANRRPT